MLIFSFRNLKEISLLRNLIIFGTRRRHVFHDNVVTFPISTLISETKSELS